MNADTPIRNHIRVLGAPPGWDHSQVPCGSLAIRDESMAGMPAIASAWKPNAAELKILNEGGSVVVRIVGLVHPPISVGVEA